jgi:fumarylpyruvate hydrolase
MTDYLFKQPEWVSVEIAGEAVRFPVHRIYCVGRNYEEHTREMGKDPAREAPIFFLKPVDGLLPNGADVPYPPRTNNFHHEIELVIAIGLSGRNIPKENALQHVYGYAVGNDYTRRDLQLAARDKGRPWDVGKSFDFSASISAIWPAARIGHVSRGRIWLEVNGVKRQDADVAQLIWNVPEISTELSTFFELKPGDLIYTGTPAGVGALKVGDVVVGGVEGIDTLKNQIVAGAS